MPLPSDRHVIGRTLLRDQAFEALCSAIVDGTLAPGEQLNDNDIADWLGFSRTPVREALARLEANGLVTATPGRSTVVAAIDSDAVNEAANVAAALHSHAMRMAVPRFAPADYAAMRAENERFAAALRSRDPRAAFEADDCFHDVALRVCGNETLTGLLTQVSPTLRRVEFARFGSLLGEESIHQHARIMTVAEAGDADGAAGAVRANWQTLYLSGGQSTTGINSRETA
ncbi:GntR family transcriptional regulator [Spelaeicoccus albus]|uniref:DNA-binding GntR family transcriptional regulator n=1 Tax=Spelaeicoccus albus TaxID=1280376 RepID=A0A7Z0AAU6_9MICO|nr:GntR family transcriptional regulator [Spelaeicoccus albus]NYI66500.1 DNA-binding GntR family transcriptional regulator [Spelaeicoccus albus]